MSLIFDTREFNVKHLYTGFYPAKQCSYFNPKQCESDRGLIFPHVIPNEIIITCRDDRGRHYPKCNQRLVMVEIQQVPYLNCL